MHPTGFMTPKDPTEFSTLADVLLYFGAESVEQFSRQQTRPYDG